jgi:hypothetical protein
LLDAVEEVAVPAKKRRSPQEEKHLSYSRDRRNSYGENDKGSRRIIALRKRARHRAERRRESALLSAAVGPVDEDVEALVDDRVTGRPRRAGRWRKSPDTQLGLHVAYGLKRRADKANSDPETERARIEKVLRNTDIDGMELSRHGYTWFTIGPDPDSPRQVQKCATMAKLRASYYPARSGSGSVQP